MKYYKINQPCWEHPYHDPVYCYTVFWVERWDIHRLKYKCFANRKDAKKFANADVRKYNVPPPYIVRQVVSRAYFKQDVKVTKAKR